MKSSKNIALLASNLSLLGCSTAIESAVKEHPQTGVAFANPLPPSPDIDQNSQNEQPGTEDVRYLKIEELRASLEASCDVIGKEKSLFADRTLPDKTTDLSTIEHMEKSLFMEALTLFAKKQWSKGRQVRIMIDLLKRPGDSTILAQKVDINGVIDQAFQFYRKFICNPRYESIYGDPRPRWNNIIRQPSLVSNPEKKATCFGSSQYGHYIKFKEIAVEEMCTEMFYCAFLREVSYSIYYQSTNYNNPLNRELFACFVEIVALSQCSEAFIREWMRIRVTGAFIDYLSCCGLTTKAGIAQRDPSSVVSSLEFTQAAIHVASELTGSPAIETVLKENNGNVELIAKLVRENSCCRWKYFHFVCMAVALQRVVNEPPQDCAAFWCAKPSLYSFCHSTWCMKNFDAYVEKLIKITNRPDFSLKNSFLLSNAIATPHAIPSSVEILNASYTYRYRNVPIITFERGSQLRRIEKNAFRSYLSLSSICIPASVNVICEHCFFECYYLATVTFEAESRLNRIEKCAFKNCYSLSSICIPSSVEFIGESCFSWCSKLATVTFESESKLSHIEKSAFQYCYSLSSICIP
ncbi:MAG: leucine-rich repeat domain-containing protein, partial [Holosporales bacterium]|nr:leucine-rich repeat domain-containing protein [Holosporales bacterium]